MSAKNKPKKLKYVSERTRKKPEVKKIPLLPGEEDWIERNQETISKIQESMGDLVYHQNLTRLRVDPLNNFTGVEHVAAGMMGDLFFRDLDDTDKQDIASFILSLIESSTPEELETTFAAIVKMKKRVEEIKIEKKPHRNIVIHLLWGAYIKEYGEPKSMTPFRYHLYEMTKGQEFNFPDPSKAAGWTPIWKQIGIDDVVARIRKAKKR